MSDHTVSINIRSTCSTCHLFYNQEPGKKKKCMLLWVWTVPEDEKNSVENTRLRSDRTTFKWKTIENMYCSNILELNMKKKDRNV